ncbi:hypothetical protein GWG54_08535 [Natronococcus sp. JC468]|uniref:HalX domain-containing protein n=1 Tax=Natronococcus sp. JC468 TaxID=1961921 RepID=UPI00143A015F|nr:HalX domain-containing protein [Natronococcus sp. JC468]NKE35866.1 hypothetical protein [Natronococcus sp. JC468]
MEFRPPLAAERDEAERADSDEYRELRDRIDELEASLEETGDRRNSAFPPATARSPNGSSYGA